MKRLYAFAAQKQRLIWYAQLMRASKPIGVWLLLWPCWWGVGLASADMPDIRLLLLFAVGAFCMRSAGCIVNDMADRRIDAQVERTKNRPLACGAVSMAEAAVLLVLLLTMSLVVVLQMRPVLVLYAALSLILVAMYPFMKRITYWPQAFLGITFNLGALFAWVAVHGQLDWASVWLYGAGICWTIGYDTIYAHQDIEDDIKIGVKSTAIGFGRHNKRWVAGFYGLCVLCLLVAVIMADSMLPAYLAPLLAACHLGWQLQQFEPNNAQKALLLFKSNGGLGFVIALLFLADAALQSLFQ